jgi:hypothetical protein
MSVYHHSVELYPSYDLECVRFSTHLLLSQSHLCRVLTSGAAKISFPRYLKLSCTFFSPTLSVTQILLLSCNLLLMVKLHSEDCFTHVIGSWYVDDILHGCMHVCRSRTQRRSFRSCCMMSPRMIFPFLWTWLFNGCFRKLLVLNEMSGEAWNVWVSEACVGLENVVMGVLCLQGLLY